MASQQSSAHQSSKVGIFCQRPQPLNDSGFADFDWFHIDVIKLNNS